MPEADGVSEKPVDAAGQPWERIADRIPHMVWVASPDGRTEYLNEQASEYLGWSPERSLDDIWNAIMHPEDVLRVQRTWRRAVRARTGYVSEFRLRRADGAYRWHCGRGLPMADAEGKVVKWIGTATDIDDHKRSAAALTEIGHRLAEAQRLAHVGSWYLDVATGARQWSDEMYRIFDYVPGSFEPDFDRILDRVHPADVSRLRAAELAQTAEPGPWDDEFRIVLPGAGLRWVAARSEPLVGESGELVAVHGTAQDVTERKIAQGQLRFQADLLDAVGEAVIATDLTGNVIYWGPGAEELYGWTAEEAFSQGVMELIPKVNASYDDGDVIDRMARAQSWSGVMELKRRDGSPFTAQVSRQPVFDADGLLVAVIGTSSDVTAREKAKAELEHTHRTTEESLTLLATLQDEAPVGIGFVDRDFRYVRLNQELASIVGAPLEDLVGRTVAEAVLPELWDRLEPVYRGVLTTGDAVRNQRVVGLHHVGGEVREWLASYYPVRVVDEIIGVGIIVQDITDRTRDEGFRSVVMSQVADGVYTEDCGGALTSMNAAASRMLGWTEADLRGKNMHEVVHFQNFDGSPVDVVDCSLRTHGPLGDLERSAGEVFTRKDGSTFPVAYSSVPLRTGSTVEGVAVVFRDVSEPGSSPKVIRVVIVDSDRTATASFQALLDRHDGIEVVAVATTSASAIDSVEKLQPDVVLIEAELPDLDGLATTAAIKAKSPSSSVILMSVKHDDTLAIAAIEAGCVGVLDKTRAWVDMVSAVRAAYHGETILSQEELQRVLSRVRAGMDTGRTTRLTDREEEVLAFMREGLSNAQVAERLGVTSNTVRNHVQRILYKLNVHSKLEAVVLSSRDGLQGGRP